MSSVARDVLNELWTAAAGGSWNSIDHLQNRIDSLPEAHVDDPVGRRYLAASVLDMLGKAVDTLAPGAHALDYQDASSGLFGEFDDFDAGPRRIDPRNPPPPGPMESAEIARQRSDDELTSRDGAREDIVAELRNRAESEAQALGEKLPTIVRAYIES
jgi:hypothetical protein